jgi:DNA-binding transcriptional LysR family regulator
MPSADGRRASWGVGEPRAGSPVGTAFTHYACTVLVLGVDGALANLPGPLWLSRAALNSKISARSNSLTNLVAALKAGLGIATPPWLVGDADPDLVRCLPPVAELDAQFWLIVREDLKSVPHVRAFAEFLWEHAQGLRAQLVGACPSTVSS